MPTIQKWTQAETEAHKAKRAKKPGVSRKDTEAIYDQLLAEMEVGEFATLTLDVGDNKPTVRNRLKNAAIRRGLRIVFERTKTNDQTIVFHLEEKEPEEKAVAR